MGTPAFAVPTLAALVGAGHTVAAVYTRAPQPAGRRGLEMTPSPVQGLAERYGLDVKTPATLRAPEAADELAAHGAALGIVVGYGMILPPAILKAMPHGYLNLHPSLLPRWRGAAPIQRPLVAGDTETAAAIMQMDEGLDTGPIALLQRMPIPPDATAGDMHDILAGVGAALMVEAVARVASCTLSLTPQPGDGVLYAPKIAKAEARIAWDETASVVHNKVRGLSPFPGAYFEADLGRGPERIKVLRSRLTDGGGAPGTILDDPLTVACGAGALRLVEVQRAGKAPMLAETFLRGTPLRAGVALQPTA